MSKLEFSFNKVTAINLILPLNFKFECEFEFTKYLKQTEYLSLPVSWTSLIQIPLNQKIFNCTKYKWKTEIKLLINSHKLS